MLWRTYGACENYGLLTGHKGAVLDLHWSRDSRVIFSASADKMLASWDLETGLRIRRHVGHEEIINCLDVSRRGEEILVSGSDDGCIGVSEWVATHGTRNSMILTLLHSFGIRGRSKPWTSSRRTFLSRQ